MREETYGWNLEMQMLVAQRRALMFEFWWTIADAVVVSPKFPELLEEQFSQLFVLR